VCGAAIGEHTVETGDLHAGEAALAAARDAAAGGARGQAEGDERARTAERDAATAQERRAAAESALGETGLSAREAGAQGEALAERAGALEAAIAAAERGVADEERAIAVEASVVAAERETIARDEAELAGARTALGRWGAHDDAGAALATALDEVRAAEREAQSTASDAAVAAEEAARTAQAVGELAAGPFATLRSVAARVAARGGLAAPADDLGPAELVPAAVRLRADALAAAAAHDAEAGRSAELAEEARTALTAAGGPLGVDDPSQVAGAARRLGASREAARALHAAVEAAARDARCLAGDAAAARAHAQVHQQVANDLRANMFPRFLLNRYQERLAAGASVRLQELTGGAYRFSGRDQDALAVVDTRRGERLRRAATLSGGERFLASLALALGLSDIAAESGGRLDSLFLDEGFSTLDADSLEQAMAGIERLAGDGRLVAVITHLPGVADHLGAVIHVEKDPAGVSRVSGDAAELAVAAAADRFPA
jgi:exonuclease SbcC